MLPALIPALLLVGVPSAAPLATSDTVLIAAPPATDATPASGVAISAQDVPAALDTTTAPVESAVPAASAPRRHAKGDPLEGFNRGMFGVHQKFDRAIFRPAGMGYKKIVPKPVRGGLRHFFSNLSEPIVFLNYLLQLKPGKAIETLARFSINSTLGLGGVLDVAKLPGVGLPHRNNGLGNTLGYYGVKPGPYIFLPLVGPSSLRDFLGGQADGVILPLAVGKPFDRLEYQVPRAVITGLDLRAESDDELKALFDGAVDPYATLRSAYQQSRQGEIDALHGKARATGPAELDDDLTDPAGGQSATPTTPELSDPMTDPAAVTPSTDAPKPEAAPKELSDPLADPAHPPPKS